MFLPSVEDVKTQTCSYQHGGLPNNATQNDKTIPNPDNICFIELFVVFNCS